MTDIPRKLSADSGHPLVGQISVFLNGVEQSGVLEYDMDEGWIECFATTENGDFIVEGGEFSTKRATGVVTVEMRDE